MRHLFVSFTALIGAIKRGEITDNDLATGLFYFGCARVHAFAPWKSEHNNELKWFFKKEDRSYDGDAAAVAHRRITDALTKAEADGRIVWLAPGECGDYEQLSELLVKNGFGPIVGNDGRHMSGSYCYPGVVDRIREAGTALAVVR